MSDLKEQLLEEIRLLDIATRDYFKVIMLDSVQAVSDKAALLNISSYTEIFSEWFPKSQMACDSDGNIYVARWLYEKKMGVI